jgi:hypothetical protein
VTAIQANVSGVKRRVKGTLPAGILHTAVANNKSRSTAGSQANIAARLGAGERALRRSAGLRAGRLLEGPKSRLTLQLIKRAHTSVARPVERSRVGESDGDHERRQGRNHSVRSVALSYHFQESSQ